MGEEVERDSHRSVPIAIAVGRLDQGAYIADHCNLTLAPEIVQAGQTRMKSEFGTNTGDNAGSQQARLRYRQSARFPSGRIGRVVVIGNNHVAAIVAAVQKNANQCPVIRRLSQRIEQTETLKGQHRSAKRSQGTA
jgi:hypothetical protein